MTDLQFVGLFLSFFFFVVFGVGMLWMANGAPWPERKQKDGHSKD